MPESFNNDKENKGLLGGTLIASAYGAGAIFGSRGIAMEAFERTEKIMNRMTGLSSANKIKGSPALLNELLRSTEIKRTMDIDRHSKSVLSIFEASQQVIGNEKSIHASMKQSRMERLLRDDSVSKFVTDPLNNLSKSGAVADFVTRANQNWDNSAIDIILRDGTNVYNIDYGRKYLGEHFDDKEIREIFDSIFKFKENYTSTNITDVANNISSTITSYSGIAKTMGVSSYPSGNRSATVNDVLQQMIDNPGYIDASTIAPNHSGTSDEFITFLQNQISENPKYGDVIFGGGLKISETGHLYSEAALNRTKRKVFGSFGDSLFGSILKVNQLTDTPPVFAHLKAGSHNPVLAAVERGGGTGTSRLLNDYFYINEKFYKSSLDGIGLQHVPELDDYTLKSSKSSFIERSMRIQQGDQTSKTVSNNIANKLDLGTSGARTVFEEASSRIKKFKDPLFSGNIINSVLNQTQVDLSSPQAIIKEHEKISRLKDVLSAITPEASMKDIRAFKDSISAYQVINRDIVDNYLDIAMSNDDELLRKIAKVSEGFGNEAAFKSSELGGLMARYKKDSLQAIKQFKQTAGGKVYFPQMVRQAIVKETLSVMEEGHTLEGMFEYIGQTDLTPQQKAIFTDLASQNVFEKLLPTKGSKDLEHMKGSIVNVRKFLQGSNPDYDTSRKSVRKALKEIRDDKMGFMGLGVSDHMERPNVKPGYTYGDFVVSKKVMPFDSISEMNMSTSKFSGFIDQFFTSRNNMENFSTVSALGVNAVDRLTHGLEQFGLGFSHASTQSALDMGLNIGLKRVMPIALALSAFSYLNFESENATGTSITQAVDNTRARANLFFRSDMAVNAMNKLRDTIVPLQYLIDEPIKTRDEYKEYLKSGYDPVRKGRYWGFGSMSEFRGGKISYFDPSYLREGRSHARDISLYGSEDEKWKYSWLPTPRHLLSPLRRILNPYYLEKKHYWDRPYPVTGKMFAEGTPWGAVLNPTIGSVLKPQRRMHVDESKRGIVDSRDIISAENERIKLESSNRRGLVRFNPDGSYNNVSASTGLGSDIIYSIKKGKLSASMSSGAESIDAISSYSFMDKVLGSTLIRDNTPLDIISQQNNNIRVKANNLVDDSIFKVKDRIGTNEYNQAKAISENRNVSSTFDLTKDMFYSMSQLSGIYGFIGGELFDKKQQYTLASADAMTGVGDVFWEQSAGGIGGGIMEIARRFFAHEDRSVSRVNYIRNTMPSWMPSRFRYGDPYDKMPKGEARLPGKGYETLNQLHPDRFGVYGAFDRAKVLADIAPWSNEYKQWRQIAASQAKGNPEMEAQLEAISNRVKRQSKTHEFYDYRFAGKKVKSSDAIIEEVMSGGKFKVMGDSSIYKIAGVELNSDADLTQILTKGQKIILGVDANNHNRANQYGIINASIKTQGILGTSSLSTELIKQGMATRNREDTSAASEDALFGPVGKFVGSITETLAHAQIPFFHDKFMRVNSPLESYRNEQIYGTPYATWSHPIQGFLIPSIRRGMAQSNRTQALAIGSMLVSEHFQKISASTKLQTLGRAAEVLTNRGAMAGAIIENLYKGNIGPVKLFSTKTAKVLPKLFTGAMMIGSTLSKTEDIPQATLSGAMTGGYLGKIFGGKGTFIGSFVGGASGAFMAMNKRSILNKEDRNVWIPQETQDRRNLDEYFDRLTYIKYKNLYERAAKLARKKEGVDIDAILDKIEDVTVNREEKLDKLYARRNKIISMYSATSSRRARLLSDIKDEISFIEKPTTGLIEAGEFTKSAVAYRRAYDSTIYGLKKNASWSQILRALPKVERDYMLAFSRESDPKKRKEIMKHISPYQKKVLQIAWKEDIDEPESNFSYFNSHAKVSSMWKGMRGDVDLEKVKIKTIENEGMDLADFGYYESQMEDPEMDDIPELPNMLQNITASLWHHGFSDAEVSIAPNFDGNFNIIASIGNTIGSIGDMITSI